MASLEATTPQLKLLQRLFDIYATLDIKKAEPFMSKNFKFRVFPKAAELPDETKEGFIKKYGQFLSLLSKHEVIIHEVIEAPGKVVLHVTSLLTIDGTTLDYDSVDIVSFVEEDGELKVVETKDFSDPQKRDAMHAEIAKVVAKRALASDL